MTELSTYALAPLFQAVGEALGRQRLALNQADKLNGNHGDHMVEIFRVATQAAQEKQEAELAEVMAYSASRLQALSGNGSAQMYANGLQQMAEQLRRYDISLDDLVGYVRKTLRDDKGSRQATEPELPHSGEVLKALVAGLANWGQVEQGKQPAENPVDMGVLFEFGMAYMQAKLHGGKRAEVLAEAAASVSPLSKLPQRYQSGKIAIQAFLEAM
jgi:hypothetical protein